MNELQLNEPQNYKAFYGRNVEQMPKLIAEGRTHMSVSDIMRKRLDVKNASKAVRNSWLYNYFDTIDGIAYHPDGRAKIVLDAQPLRGLTPSSELRNRALVLPFGMYETLEGQEFSKDDLEKYASGDWLKQKVVRDNSIWQTLARDESLLGDYSDMIFSQGYDRAMGIFRAPSQDVLTMRSWCLGRFGGSLRSVADGKCGLDCDYGRLVGVAPEAQSSTQKVTIAKPTLDQVFAVTGKYVADVNRDNLREDLGKLYQ